MKRKKAREIGIKIYSMAVCALTPAAAFVLLETMTHKMDTMSAGLIFLNLLFYYLFYGLALALLRQSRLALSLGTVVFALIGLADYYVIAFRSAPIFPWDLLSLGTAASVSDNYSYALDPEQARNMAAFALLLAAGLFTRVRIRYASFQQGILTVLLAITGLATYSSAVQTGSLLDAVGFYPYLFTPNSFYQQNGFMVSFLSNMQYLRVSAPKDYDPEQTEAFMEPYVEEAEAAAEEETDVYPNIIVIMNEALSDPAVLGPFETNEDYMPFIRSLPEENKGEVYVSVKGGNTANTEYEFLTGDSMAFLPQGSIPYQQYMTGSMPGLVSLLNEKGYETVSIHPYNASGWNRDDVYEWFGFSTSLFKGAFGGAEIIREYVSDAATYDKIVELYANKDADTPLFVFDVTMQNHSSYSKTYSNFTPDIQAEGVGEGHQLNTYLSLVKKSDEAFRELVGYFSQAEEPTIILMFGDHQPNDWVVDPIYDVNGQDQDALSFEESQERYKVPYVLWANFDMETDGQDVTSVNYLGGRLLAAAGLSLSPYQYYLEDLSGQLPVITGSMYMDKDGAIHAHDIQGDEKDETALLAYERLCYYHLFEEDRNDSIFGNGKE